MQEFKPQPLYQFSYIPDVGQDNWQYAFAAAEVRALDTTFLPRSTFVEMINSPDYSTAAECLTGTDYSFVPAAGNFTEVENGLIGVRHQARQLYVNLIQEADYLEILRMRADFANLRLAIRRLVTEQDIGSDYSNEGHISADKFEEVLQQENYIEFPLFLQEAVEQAILRYYENKDIRQIDYGIDLAFFQYITSKGEQMSDLFLTELARMNSDIYDIKTMLRLKFRDSQQTDCFSCCGYLDKQKLIYGLDLGYDSIAAVFANTPYFDIVNEGASYLAKHNSFLKLEQMCNNYVLAYLKSTSRITAGPEPVVAYLLRKEMEVRAVRMVLTGKKHNLEQKMLLDGLYDVED